MIRKLLILVGVLAIVAILWFVGAQTLYARVLVFIANIFLGMFGSNASLALEAQNGEYLFRVFTIIDGRTANYPQELQSLLYPTIIVMSWCLFVLISTGHKKALGSAKWCLLPFLAAHMVFLFLLTSYYGSATARFFYDILRESLFVIAVALVIIDQIRSPIFSLSSGK